MKEITLQEMLSTIIGELRENGRWGTAHIYQSTLNVFSAFNNYRDLHLRKLNPVVLKRFEMHLRQRDYLNMCIQELKQTRKELWELRI